MVNARSPSSLLSRVVTVNRSLTPQQALDATGRRKFSDTNVLTSMPCGDGGTKTVFFLKLDRSMGEEEVDRELARYGLTPTDSYSLAKVNQDDPTFADNHPNATHWRDASGNWCFAAFARWPGRRRVSVNRGGGGWDGGWWIAGEQC